jgi:hypothetical protein
LAWKFEFERTFWVKTFGIIDGGLELMNAAWPTMHQVLVVQQDKMPALEKLHESRGVLPLALYKTQ